MASLGLLILRFCRSFVGSDQEHGLSRNSISYLIGTAIIFLAGSLFVGIRACAAYFSPLQSGERILDDATFSAILIM